jgi:hypothetical protein
MGKPKAFSGKEGGIQSSDSTGRTPKDQGGAPKTGFDDAPTESLAAKGPGAGIGNSRPGIR